MPGSRRPESFAGAEGVVPSRRVYHSGRLGRENDTVDLARFGALDIIRINFASLNNTFPAIQQADLTRRRR